jgi:large subunit ribosomal protein L17
LALRRNMAQSLFEHGQIRTTLPKAKDLRPFVERLITLARTARQGSLAARQRLTALLGDRAIIPADHRETYEDMSDARRAKVMRSRSGRRYRHGQAKAGQSFTAMSVVHHLINNVAPRFDDRAGGYTRVIRLGTSAKGDNSPLAVLQLVGEEESPGTVTRPEKTARKRRTERRYAFAAKAVKQTKPADEAAQAEVEAEAPAEQPEAEAPAEDQAAEQPEEKSEE